MTSSSLTEGEILKVLLSGQSSFERIVSHLSKDRKTRQVRLGSRSTISHALKKGLYEKRFVDYDVASRKWMITSLGRWISNERLTLTSSASALSRVTQPLINEVEKHPEQLIDLLSEMFVYSASGGNLPINEDNYRKQTKAKLALFSENTEMIKMVWIDAVELLIGKFSSLMAAILLYRSSTLEKDNAQSSTIIQKIVEQWFRFLSVEMAAFLSKHLADLPDLATLYGKKEGKRPPARARYGTVRK